MARRNINDLWRLRQLNDPPLSQRELALLVGVDEKQIWTWERGERLPSLENAVKLALVLHTTVEDLFYEVFEDASEAERIREHRDGTSPVKRPFPRTRRPWDPQV